MELNREQIVKALEYFHQRILDTDLAKNIYEAEMMAIIDAIALIRELTEEKEHWEKQYKESEAEYNKAEKRGYAFGKADTVRKMQERLKESLVGFSDEFRYWAEGYIAKIAKEMLEEQE